MKKRIFYILASLLIVGIGLGIGLPLALKDRSQGKTPALPVLLESGLYNSEGLVQNWDSLVSGDEPAILVEGTTIVDCDRDLAGELVLPEEIEVIGIDAFLSCQLLTKVTLPSAVKEICLDAFYNCTELVEVVIPSDSVLKTIGYGAFTYCHKLTTLNIPASVDLIDESAFLGCTVLDHIRLPESITRIEAALFKDCEALSDLSYGDIDYIGSQAFYNCRSLSSFDFKNTKSIGFSAFWNCKALESVVLPATVASLGDHVFTRCSALKSVLFENPNTVLGIGCFEDCIALTSADLPDFLNAVPDYTFYGCEALEAFTIGEHVSRIGKFAFKDCFKLVLTFSAQGNWGYLDGTELVSFDLCGEDSLQNRLELVDGKEDKVFEIMRYTISFELNGYGDAISDKHVSYIPDSLPKPTAEGMIFSGWYLDVECTIPAQEGEIILSNVVLYAKWVGA